jgi:hypothetical protein
MQHRLLRKMKLEEFIWELCLRNLKVGAEETQEERDGHVSAWRCMLRPMLCRMLCKFVTAHQQNLELRVLDCAWVGFP